MTTEARDSELAKVWATDADGDMAWCCPDCDSWATLGGNAGYHAEKTGHGVPSWLPRPDLAAKSRAAESPHTDVSTTERAEELAQLCDAMAAHADSGEDLSTTECAEVAQFLRAYVQARAELLRLAGPECEHDGKRAIEHRDAKWLCSVRHHAYTGDHATFGGEPICGERLPDGLGRCLSNEGKQGYVHQPCNAHPPAPAIEEWLRRNK